MNNMPPNIMMLTWVTIERTTQRKSDATKERQMGNSYKRATKYYLLERVTYQKSDVNITKERHIEDTGKC